jgi:uncharacterized protein (DUF302 family)
MKDTISIDVRMKESYEAAIERVTDALKAEGFGVLTRIDVKATLKEKIGEEFRPYVILGACNPNLAHRALNRHPEVGVMLPCNVTVEDNGEGGSYVRIADPDVMMGVGGMEGDAAMREIAGEAGDRLRRVARALEG